MRLANFSDEARCIEIEAKLEERLLDMVFAYPRMLAYDLGYLRLDLGLLVEMASRVILSELKLYVVADVLNVAHVYGIESALKLEALLSNLIGRLLPVSLLVRHVLAISNHVMAHTHSLFLL